MTKDKFFNMAATVGSMIRVELAQEDKWANNKRCKEPNWDYIASYLSYVGVEVTPQDVKEVAHLFNWGKC